MSKLHRAACRLLLVLLSWFSLSGCYRRMLAIYLSSGHLQQCTAGLRECYLSLPSKGTTIVCLAPAIACKTYKSNADNQQRKYVATQHEGAWALEHTLGGLSGHAGERPRPKRHG